MGGRVVDCLRRYDATASCRRGVEGGWYGTELGLGCSEGRGQGGRGKGVLGRAALGLKWLGFCII